MQDDTAKSVGVVAVCMANASWRNGQMMGWDVKIQRMTPASTIEFSPYPEKSTKSAISSCGTT